jgi:hypothetical protein
VDGAYSMDGGEEECVQVIGRKARGKRPLERPRWDGVVWTGLVWLGIGASGKLL